MNLPARVMKAWAMIDWWGHQANRNALTAVPQTPHQNVSLDHEPRLAPQNQVLCVTARGRAEIKFYVCCDQPVPALLQYSNVEQLKVVRRLLCKLLDIVLGCNDPQFEPCCKALPIF